MTVDLQDNKMTTVEEMLAFLNSFEWDEDLINEDHVNVDIECLIVPTEASASESTSNVTKTPKRKRIRTGWSSSTGLQRRKRAELQFLRAQVKEMEAFVKQLKTRGAQPLIFREMDRMPIDWQEVALNEFIERKKSEEANRILKNIVGNLTLANNTLNEVQQK
ncbi:hypothetical protein P3T76_015256 [Phytophthora citrophthora]|uniref:Uncharacterized protein n=1 Tax=Phytophthora citrophthora TaxID=4793 RepID=A0AAD9LBL9_9STRA|nr:hypothetical protein P3T76_015256 [Phytophthora citrophthora]